MTPQLHVFVNSGMKQPALVRMYAIVTAVLTAVAVLSIHLYF